MPKNDLEQYKDPYGLTPKKLRFGLWYVTHRKYFRMTIIVTLVLVSVVTWFIAIYTFTHYIVVGIKEDEELSRKIVENISFNHDYILKIAPENLKVSGVTVLKHIDQYDLFAVMGNKSENYWAHFNYYFVIDGKETERISSFILPGESKHLAYLSYNTRPKKVEIKVVDIAWEQINKHVIHDWKAFRDEHINVQFDDIGFTQSKQTGLSEKINVSTLEFNAINNSPYNYWQVSLTIVLYSRDVIVSVNRYTIDEFLSGQKRNIHISIPGLGSNITKTEILPEIDITRDDIYMKY